MAHEYMMHRGTISGHGSYFKKVMNQADSLFMSTCPEYVPSLPPWSPQPQSTPVYPAWSVPLDTGAHIDPHRLGTSRTLHTPPPEEAHAIPLYAPMPLPARLGRRSPEELDRQSVRSMDESFADEQSVCDLLAEDSYDDGRYGGDNLKAGEAAGVVESIGEFFGRSVRALKKLLA